ncbi:MAG: hypothetical protein KAG61_11115, partial [Bacteriovoracaceae bacterium]|nr:hypothetical protein [Bacteriovoracaceae bacterium]
MKIEQPYFLALRKKCIAALACILLLWVAPAYAIELLLQSENGTENMTPKEMFSAFKVPANTNFSSPQKDGTSGVFTTIMAEAKKIMPFLRNEEEKIAVERLNKIICTNSLTEKLKELTSDSLSDRHVMTKDKYLAVLLRNQAEISFAKYSRAFIRAGYYDKLNGESEEKVIAKLEMMLNDPTRAEGATAEDIEVIKQFFNSVQTPQIGKDTYGFDEISNALSLVSKKDEEKYRLNRADALIMNSLVNFSSPGKKKTELNNRLLSQIRSVFRKRNAATADLNRSEEVIDGYNGIRNLQTFKSAKDAFVKKAKGVITDYVKKMNKQCQKYFIVDDKINFDSISSNCSTGNYLRSLFDDKPLTDIKTILEFINENQLSWKGKKFLRVASVKLTPISCTVNNGKIELVMNLKRVPKDFNTPWTLGCPTCSPVELNNEDLKIEYQETKKIPFKGELPKNLRLENSNVNWSDSISLEKCNPT